ncbi:MAG: LysM peptidoglycan-binding domain-containing protein, partial [Bryobacter sp.]|nr:LysM peptidoglycan-binding domain-containing protein [Bryobacter sp.]
MFRAAKVNNWPVARPIAALHLLDAVPTLQSMKMDVFSRRFIGLACLAWLTAAPAAWGQTGGNDAAFRQEMEERYERLRIRAEETQAAQVLLQKRFAALADELQSLRQQLDRGNPDFAMKEDLRRLAESIREIDRKREEDKKLILDELRKLASAPLPAATPPKRTPTPPASDSTPPSGPRKGYEYEVKPGDTIGAIVAAYQQSGVKVTVQQVLKANPNLNP